jgi:hypothetical protein
MELFENVMVWVLIVMFVNEIQRYLSYRPRVVLLVSFDSVCIVGMA